MITFQKVVLPLFLYLQRLLAGSHHYDCHRQLSRHLLTTNPTAVKQLCSTVYPTLTDEYKVVRNNHC